MPGWEADAAWILGQVIQPERLTLVEQRADDPAPVGWIGAQQLLLLGRQPRRLKELEPAVFPQQPDGSVARVEQPCQLHDDALEQLPLVVQRAAEGGGGTRDPL